MDVVIPVYPIGQGHSVVIDGVTYYAPVVDGVLRQIVAVTNDVQIGRTGQAFTFTAIAIDSSGNNTIFTPDTGKRWFISHLLLVAAAALTIKLLSGTSYLVGSAGVGVALAANGGWAENGSVLAPVYESVTTSDAFIVNLSAAEDVAGHVVWYEQ